MAEIVKKGASKPSKMDNFHSINTSEVVNGAIDSSMAPATV